MIVVAFIFDFAFTLAVGYVGAMFAVRRALRARVSSFGTDDAQTYREAMQLLQRMLVREDMGMPVFDAKEKPIAASLIQRYMKTPEITPQKELNQ